MITGKKYSMFRMCVCVCASSNQQISILANHVPYIFYVHTYLGSCIVLVADHSTFSFLSLFFTFSFPTLTFTSCKSSGKKQCYLLAHDLILSPTVSSILFILAFVFCANSRNVPLCFGCFS